MKFILAAIAAFMILFVYGFLIHGMVLRPDYLLTPELYRPDADAITFMPYLFLSYAVKAFAFTYIYRQGISTAPWFSQGIRYGIIVSLLMVIPHCLMSFAVQPLSATLVVKQMTFETIGTILASLAVAYILRPTPLAEEVPESIAQ